MPVHKIQGGYQYGQTGKKYYGKDAKKKAKLQELAIRLSGYKEDDEKKKRRYLKHEADSETIGREFVSEFFNDDQLQHHGILGQKWGIRRFQPYPSGYRGDGKFVGKILHPRNLVARNDFKKMKQYPMVIVGEIHNRDMIKYYDKLLTEKKPEYFICEFADTDRCYTRKQLKDRMDHATDGAVGGVGADYQYNYWAYELAYKHGCKLIGCNTGDYKNTGRMHDEDAVREKYMLDVLKEFQGKNSVVQLGDHHLRSIPITKDFLDYTGDTEDDRGIVSDLTVDNASPVWEYFANRKDTCITRVDDEYETELAYAHKKGDNFLQHHGIKGMHWGVWNSDTRARYSGGRKHIRESTKKNVTLSRTSNVEKWGKDKKHNVLYVTGLSGSGKSTVAEGLRDSKTNVLHLDFFTNAGNTLYAKGHRDPEFVEHLKKEVPDYFDRYNGEFPALSKLSPEEKKAFWKTMDEFQDAIVSFGEKQYAKGKKVIAEGVQIADETLFVDKNFFKDQPLMILSTDKDTSLKRAAERDEIELNDEEAMKFRKIMQDNWSRQVATLAQTADVKTGQIYVEQILKKLA